MHKISQLCFTSSLRRKRGYASEEVHCQYRKKLARDDGSLQPSEVMLGGWTVDGFAGAEEEDGFSRVGLYVLGFWGAGFLRVRPSGQRSESLTESDVRTDCLLF